MHTTLQLLGRPLVGSLIEWTFIVLWIGAWATIAFLLTRIGNNLVDLDLAEWPGAGIGLWIALWLSAMLFRFYWHGKYTDPERLAKARLGHILYHVVRWPLLFGMVASADTTVMTVALWLDTLCVLLVGIVALVIYLYRCEQSGR
jgi:hypothetical protein